ncbi:hypothetical protein HWV62_27909 [Athelia sp. TMB]|nr:hypothetical protein HWV62_27909 [Athelia sp. TMB]
MATLHVPSNASSSRASLAQSQSIRSQQSRSQRYPTLRSIVTSPPWANDEPPSPTSDDDNHTIQGRRSDAHTPRPSITSSSYHSSAPPGSATESRWWTFARPNGRGEQQHAPSGLSGALPVEAAVDTTSQQGSPKIEKRGMMFRERSRAWLPTNRRSQDVTPSKTPGFDQHRSARNEDGAPSNWGLTIDLPPPPAPFTMAQSQTPGWNSPWTPRVPNQPISMEEEMFGRDASDEGEKTMSRKKRLRRFILTNPFVPLLFRFINITFTTSALAIAIRIRLVEMHHQLTGIVGSSPTLVIIFAPLTLVHVLVAIYLEYFGRPLGLWHTSSKLTHTLLEVLFICAWSAALSLCFDNYFTSLVPCASKGSISWYSNIPRPASPYENLGGIGEGICDDQLVLIVLVIIGLLMYCINLNISLFRIFEKVKYHPGSGFHGHT